MSRKMRIDPQFWSDYFDTIFPRQIVAFCDAITSRVLPAFARIDEEAEAVADEEYDRLGRIPCPDYYDGADAAEKAQEVGLVYYQTVEAVRQTLLNMAATALYHMFEQQLLLFHRRQVLHPSEENDKKLISLRELKKRLSKAGIDIEALPSWSKVDELRVVANTVKHAEGDSADQLRSLRPDLYTHPVLREDNLSWDGSSHPIYLPLGGEDIYISEGEIQEYGAALVSFWREFGQTIRS